MGLDARELNIKLYNKAFMDMGELSQNLRFNTLPRALEMMLICC